MNNKDIKVKILNFVYDLVDRFLIRKKFDKQIGKLQKGIFDNSLNFEKIECKKGVIFYSFRIDIDYRAYLRKENDVFIVFDINNHYYEIIKNKIEVYEFAIGDNILNETFDYCFIAGTREDGKITCIVKSLWHFYIVVEDTIVSKFTSNNLKNFENIYIQPDGNIAGKVLVGQNWYPFVGNEIKEKIGNEDFKDCDDIHTQPNGTLAGRVKIGKIYYPFIGDEIIKKICGIDIVTCLNIHTQPNGTLAGRVKIGKKYYPFVGDTIIYKIGNQEIEYCSNIHTKPDGTLAGEILIGEEGYNFLYNFGNTKNILIFNFSRYIWHKK